MRVEKVSLSILFCLLFLSDIKAEERGAETLVSIEPFYSFPAVPPTNPNQMLTFGFFRNGFGLQDRTTTCTFKSVFPVSGSVNLNGGQLYLANDLILQDAVSFNSAGIIIGNNHTMEFSSGVTGIPALYNSVFKDTKLFLNSDFLVSGTIKFKGNCLLDGRWNRMTIGDNANIVVDRNSTLCLRNIEIDKIKRSNIRCLNSDGGIILDNVAWDQDANFTFTRGSLKFVNNVIFSGPWQFSYTSALTSTIDMDSTWMISDLTRLSIGRQGSVLSRDPLYFSDITSVLMMRNSTLNVTSNGMRVTRGTLLVDGEVKFDVNSTGSANGFAFGNGDPTQDMIVKVSPASVVNLIRGDLVHDVVALGNFVSDDVQKIFMRQGVGANYWSNFDSYFINVDLRFALGGLNYLAPGVHGFFNGCRVRLDSLGLEFSVTATRVNDFIFGLNCGGSVNVTNGTFISPLGVSVYGPSNIFTAVGDVSGSITLKSPASGLLLGVNGGLLTNVAMNGGTVTLASDLTLDRSFILSGTGNLILGTKNMTLGSQDTIWTSSIAFSGNGSQIFLRSMLSLGSTVTFNGTCTIDGDNNELRLSSLGNIVVGKNSTLVFKNISLTGVSGNKLRCFDDSSKIVLQNTDWVQDNNYSLTVGSLEVRGNTIFSGASHPFMFAYQTTQTALITRRSTAIFDHNFTFSYDPINKNKTGIAFTDDTSELILNGATLHVTRNGMQLKSGNLVISNASALRVEGDLGLTLGNNSSADDCIVNIQAGGQFNVFDGSLIYQNIKPASYRVVNIMSILRMHSGTILQLDQPLNLDAGRLLLHIKAGLIEATPSNLTGILEMFE